MLPFAAVDWKDATTLKSALSLALPEALLLAAACVIFLGGTFRASRRIWGWAALLAVAVAALVWWNTPFLDKIKASDSPLLPDTLATFIRGIAFAGGMLYILLSWDDLTDEIAADFYACFLILIAGVSLVGAANELITIFLALELISIPTYVMLYLPKSGKQAQEATIKYFLLSVFSSAFLLFGFSYLYGISGTTNLTAIFQEHGQAKAATIPGLFLVAFIMIIAGLGFRITAVPFHFYAPDVFQGAPTSMGALLAFIPKVAGFAALIRILGILHTGTGTNLVSESQVSLLLWILAAITMSLGNILALLQDNLKRMLAYSSVAHAGYMLIGLAAAPELKNSETSTLHGTEAILFYLVAYGAMTVGAFAVLSYLSTSERQVESIDDLAGLGRSHPATALVMGLFMFSLIGLPLTAGFWGKLQLFLSALQVQRSQDQQPLFVILAVIAAINGAIAGYYYLRVVAVMFLRDPLKPLRPRLPMSTFATMAICAAITLVLGVYPAPLARITQNAAAAITAAFTPVDQHARR